jgi:glycosyltransferase involved in cell wall biosynthesis
MRVLFASGIDGFCHRYAVLHWAEQLAGQGIASTVRAHVDPRLAGDLAGHEVLVLYRVPHSPWVAHLLARARALGRATVFAVDDLIVCPEIPEPPPLRRMDAAERRLWHDGVRRYRATLLACDAFLATTGPLAEVGAAAGKPTHLHRCGLAARELALGAAAARDAAAARASAAAAGAFRLGYFSGTPTHDGDLAAVTPILLELLERHPALALVVAGPVALDPRFARLGARVARVAAVPWPELPRLIADVDASLAPLEWRHPFVAAKGAVKYLEAAAAGVPTIASPTDAFRDAIRHGETGLLAEDAAAWRAALAALAGDPAHARRLGDAARADVAARFGPASQGPALAAILAEVAARAPRPTGAVAVPVDEIALARAFPGEVARAAREPGGLPGFAVSDAAEITPPLGDAAPLLQPFPATVDGLARVDVQTVTYGQALDHELRARVLREDGSVAAARTLAAALAPDRGWLAVELPPESGSAGRTYRLELTARGAGRGNALSFGATARPTRAGPFAIGGVAGPGSLALRTFAGEAPAP